MDLQPIEKVCTDDLSEERYFAFNRVSTYDPNMCSTARFSPPPPYTSDDHQDPPEDEAYRNIILVPCSDDTHTQQHLHPSIITAAQESQTYVVPVENREFVAQQRQRYTTATPSTSKSPDSHYNHENERLEPQPAQIILQRSPNGTLYQNYYVSSGHASEQTGGIIELVPIDSNNANVYQQHFVADKHDDNLSSVEYSFHSKLPHNGELIEHFVNLEVPDDQHQGEFLAHNPPAVGLLEKDPQRMLLESTMSPLLAAVNDITQRDAELQSYLNQNLGKDHNIEMFGGNHVEAQNGIVRYDEQPKEAYVDLNFAKNAEKNGSRVLRSKTRVNKEDDDEDCLLVSDKPVESRSRASLPTNYLYFGNSVDKTTGISVFAKKEIPQRTKFGPFEGELHLSSDVISDVLLIQASTTYPLLLVNETSILDVSDENLSNWMRFVRMAHTFTEQNLQLFEVDGKLYFKSCQVINPKQELKVGYSEQYAQSYGLKVIQPTEEEAQAIFRREYPWLCYECDQWFATSDELQNHLSIHDLSDDVAGEAKPKHSRKKRKQPRHVLDIRKNSSRCVYCNKVFMTIVSLKKHMSTHLAGRRTVGNRNGSIDMASRIFRCTICYKKFASDKRLKAHRLVHIKNELKPYQCSQCDRCCSTPAASAAHIRSHSNRHFTCVYCQEKFKYVLEFKNHVISHSVNGFYPCHLCKKKYHVYYLVRKHIRMFHSTVKFSCNECGRQFRNMAFLRRHNVCHSEKYDFLCSQCGKQFKRKDKLREHILRIHSENRKQRENKKKQKVPVTEKYVNDDGSSYLAMSPKKSRESAAPPPLPNDDYQRFVFKCNDCMLGFKRRGMLVNHMAKRHPEVCIESIPELNLPILKKQSLFYCQYCSKVYKSNSKRKLHILKNHPGQDLPPSARTITEPSQINARTIGNLKTEPQRCKWCYKQYASRNRLVMHQRKEHPNVNSNGENSKSSPSFNDYDDPPPIDAYRPPCSPENKLLKLSSAAAALELSSIEDRKFFDFLNERSQYSLQQSPMEESHAHDNGFSKVDVNFKVVEEFGETSSNGELNRLPQLFEESIACI